MHLIFQISLQNFESRRLPVGNHNFPNYTWCSLVSFLALDKSKTFNPKLFQSSYFWKFLKFFEIQFLLVNWWIKIKSRFVTWQAKFIFAYWTTCNLKLVGCTLRCDITQNIKFIKCNIYRGLGLGSCLIWSPDWPVSLLVDQSADCNVKQ